MRNSIMLWTLLLAGALGGNAAAAADAPADDELDFLLGDAEASPVPAEPAPAASAPAEPAPAPPAAASPAPETLPTIPVATQPTPVPAARPRRAQRQIEEIIVTAQKTEQSIQDVPVSITAVNGDFMNEVGAVSIADVAAYIPNLKFSSDNDPALTQISIRGFGTSPLNSGFESSVGYVQDELFLGRAPYITDGMFDIERVEVLRGPQGTLFGKNTTAGVFNVLTKGPTEEFGADLRLSVSDPDERRIEAGVGGMFASWGGIRLALLDIDHPGGELYNTTRDRPEDRARQQAQRLKLLLKPTEALELELSAQHAQTSASYWPVQLDNLQPSTLAFLRNYDPQADGDGYNHRLSHDYDGYLDKDSDTLGLIGRWSIGKLGPVDDLRATLVLGDSEMGVDAAPDLDTSPADIGRIRTTWNYKQQSAELRLDGVFNQGLFGLGERIDFIAGGFYMESHMDQVARVSAGEQLAAYAVTGDALRQIGGTTFTFPLPGLGLLAELLSGVIAPVVGDDAYSVNYLTEVQTLAFFGQATWHLNEHWALTPGLRINREKKQADMSGVSTCTLPPLCLMRVALNARDYDAPGLSRDEDDVSPKLSLQYFPSDDLSLFASYTRGYKSGGFNAASFDGRNLQFEPENVESWEAGFKSMLLDRSLSLNATVFYSYFDDLQTLAIDGAFINVANAATAISQGVEVDAMWYTPLPFLTLMGSLGVLDAHYDSYPNGQPTVNMPSGSVQDLSGKELAFAPKLTASLTPTITVPVRGLMMQFAVDWLYQGDQYTDIDLDPHTFVPAHSTWSGRVALSHPEGRWSLAIGGSNLTDENYATQVVDTAFFPGAYGVTQQAGRKLFAAFQFKF
ncbi:TonB-dependent receptor [Solimonas sp. K1W22B-7]|uniref:TonB-dependent receptor n=1 Tax=Solimonas sp. K1W22B-7 TaxID=2303331 RepID=UPI000E336743|nr:TonB-dependent receptor [Solimonas sp. K1W22B-7]AXQ30652.1 TonB-dependent receptor [Solimonas sp. K1W22B-7]